MALTTCTDFLQFLVEEVASTMFSWKCCMEIVQCELFSHSLYMLMTIPCVKKCAQEQVSVAMYFSHMLCIYVQTERLESSI